MINGYQRTGWILGLGLSMALCAGAADNKIESWPVHVYKDGGAGDNRFIPSGFTGDYNSVQMLDKCRENPKAGDSCIRFTYTGEPTERMNWAGVFFQYPANNWGTDDNAYDLTTAKKLRFFARGDQGGEVVEFKFGGVNGPAAADSDAGTTGPVILTADWRQYEIPLEGLDLSHIFSGFAWIASSEKNPAGFVIYLDEIEFVAE